MQETHTINNYTLYVDDKMIIQSSDKMFILGEFYNQLGNNHKVKIEDKDNRILITNYID